MHKINNIKIYLTLIILTPNVFYIYSIFSNLIRGLSNCLNIIYFCIFFYFTYLFTSILGFYNLL